MKSIPIDQCSAGPLLDAAAAEAMGWEQAEQLGTLYWIDSDGKCQYPVRDVEPTTIGPGMSWQDGDYEYGFQPSKDIAMAMLLIDAVSGACEDNTAYYGLFIEALHGQLRKALWESIRGSTISWFCLVPSELRPLVITRAFCKAHGITEVKIPDG